MLCCSYGNPGHLATMHTSTTAFSATEQCNAVVHLHSMHIPIVASSAAMVPGYQHTLTGNDEAAGSEA